MDVEGGPGVVPVVADQVGLVRRDDDILEVGERVGELPVDLPLGEGPGDDEALVAGPLALPGDDNTAALALVEEDLLDVGLLLLESELSTSMSRTDPRYCYANNLMAPIIGPFPGLSL